MSRPSLALPHFSRAIAARGALGYAPSALRIFRHMSDEASHSLTSANVQLCSSDFSP
jgi:hypothetical protein